MKKRVKYDKSLPGKMYAYFIGFDDIGAPSFSKFAQTQRITLSELESFRTYKKFDEAYRECSEIRRDYLIDSALGKRSDSSFTKFVLCSEFSMGETHTDAPDNHLSVTLEVVDGK